MGGQLRDRKREARLPLGSRAPLASCAEGRRVRNAAALTYTTTSSYEQMLEEKGGGVWNRWKFTFRLCCPQPWGRFRHRVEDGKVEPMLKPGPFPVYCKIHRQWGLGERVTIHAVNGSRGPALDTCDTLVTFLRYSNSEG